MYYNKLNNKYLYIGCAVVIVCIYVVLAIYSITYKPPALKTTVPDLPSAIPTSSARLSPAIKRVPKLLTTLAVGIPGEFTVSFPAPVDPDKLTTTLAQSTLDPNSPTISVPFTASFSAGLRTMTIKTTTPIAVNRMYSIYVRLKSNNHIVVKKRFKSTNESIVPITE